MSDRVGRNTHLHFLLTVAHVRQTRDSAARGYRSVDVVEERAAWLFREHPNLAGPDIAAEPLRLLPGP
jgi:hypothetical protein